MRGFTAICSLALVSVGFVAAADDCKYAIEVVQLQDASDTLKDDITTLKAVSQDLFSSLNSEYPGLRYALASFTDKPIPLAGYGKYGGYQDVKADYCYNMDMDFATTAEEFSAALDRVKYGSGNDVPETMLEAMLYTVNDKSLSWSSGAYSSDGRPIVKFVVQITDSYPHPEGDATDFANTCWNWPRSWANGVYSGGYGASDLNSKYKQNYYNGEKETDYQAMSLLFQKLDAGDSFTDDEIDQFKSLNATFGPYPWPAITSPHPGEWDPKECAFVEYPSTATVANALVSNNVFPIFLIANPDSYIDQHMVDVCSAHNIDARANPQDCLVSMYNELLTDMGVTGTVAKLGASSEDIVQIMMANIQDIVSEVCQTPTTTAAPTTATTTATVTTATTTSSTADVVPPPVVISTTSAPTLPTVSTASDNTAKTDSGDNTTTGSGDKTDKTESGDNTSNTGADGTTKSLRTTSAATTTSSTTAGAPVAPVPASGGASTAVVAAAGAGAAAAVAAAGLIAYKKFGAGAFAKKSAGGLDAVQQVDIPESPLEREAMEEVTMDMFQ